VGGNKKEIDGTLKADGDDVELIAEPDQRLDILFAMFLFLSLIFLVPDRNKWEVEPVGTPHKWIKHHRDFLQNTRVVN